MSKNTKIQWCDHTFNPWEGCTKVSEGCKNCYAEARDKRWHGGTAIHWGKGAPRRRTSEENWKLPLKWNWQGIMICECGREVAAKLQKGSGRHLTIDTCVCNSAKPPLKPRRPRLFCASLADWLDDEVPIEWLADLLELIAATPNLDWLLLTKRPENFHERIHAAVRKAEGIEDGKDWPEGSCKTRLGEWINEWTGGIAPDNVWIGTSVENQAMADKRIPELLEIPARVRFLSCEPLLGPVDLVNVEGFNILGDSGIDWVICGGESGQGARPMHAEWARSLRDQCQAADVPFLFKQWGEWLPDQQNPAIGLPSGPTQAMRIGKKKAGRLLDGREWNEFPKGRWQW